MVSMKVLFLIVIVTPRLDRWLLLYLICSLFYKALFLSKLEEIVGVDVVMMGKSSSHINEKKWLFWCFYFRIEETFTGFKVYNDIFVLVYRLLIENKYLFIFFKAKWNRRSFHFINMLGDSSHPLHI